MILVEAGERILPSFDAKLASRVVRDLESLGVQVWTKSLVTDLDGHFVTVGEERIKAGTVLWAAGVQASMFDQKMDVECVMLAAASSCSPTSGCQAIPVCRFGTGTTP